MEIIRDTVIAILAVAGLYLIAWVVSGAILLHSVPGSDEKLTALISAKGTASLEQTIHTLLWLKRTGIVNFDILIADIGLSSDSREIAQRLADDNPAVKLYKPKIRL